jgi:AraC-like DNA-binding protein
MRPSHSAWAFKSATGHPPHFYLTTEELRLAQSMLSEGSLSVTGIAARVDVQPPPHFTALALRTTPTIRRCVLD